MKYLIFAAALATAAFAAPAPVSAQIGVSLNVGEPNFYGRIELGDAPAPRLIYRRPVVIEGQLNGRQPLYLHVRPGYERNWRRHCGEYNACDQPVLFVRDDWYRRRYVPHYRQHRDSYEHRGDNRGDEHGDRRGDDHGDRRGDDHGDKRDHH